MNFWELLQKMFWSKEKKQIDSEECKKLLEQIEKLRTEFNFLKIHQSELETSVRMLNTRVAKKFGKLPTEEAEDKPKDIYNGILCRE